MWTAKVMRLGTVLLLMGTLSLVQVVQGGKKVFCYFSSSTNARAGVGKFWPENIDPFLCTHLIFAFADIAEGGDGLEPNNWNDLGRDGLYMRTLKLKEQNPKLKLILAVGGWRIGSTPFLPVIETQESMGHFAAKVVEFLRHYGFDGMDMDWEFPGIRGSDPADKFKFTTLMKTIQQAFQRDAAYTRSSKLILTMAAAASKYYAEIAYEQDKIWRYLDYILLMTYNYHGANWENVTGHHSALLPHRLDKEADRQHNFYWSVEYWLRSGIPPEKLCVGLATYGISFKLADKKNHGVRAPSLGPGSPGPYTNESGILAYYEICERLAKKGWQLEWIDDQYAPYAHGDGDWVGFENQDSLIIKMNDVLKRGLGGVLVWSVEMDDFRGRCNEGKYPLLRAINNVLKPTFDKDDWIKEQEKRQRKKENDMKKNNKPGMKGDLQDEKKEDDVLNEPEKIKDGRPKDADISFGQGNTSGDKSSDAVGKGVGDRQSNNNERGSSGKIGQWSKGQPGNNSTDAIGKKEKKKQESVDTIGEWIKYKTGSNSSDAIRREEGMGSNVKQLESNEKIGQWSREKSSNKTGPTSREKAGDNTGLTSTPITLTNPGTSKQEGMDVPWYRARSTVFPLYRNANISEIKMNKSITNPEPRHEYNVNQSYPIRDKDIQVEQSINSSFSRDREFEYRGYVDRITGRISNSTIGEWFHHEDINSTSGRPQIEERNEISPDKVGQWYDVATKNAQTSNSSWIEKQNITHSNQSIDENLWSRNKSLEIQDGMDSARNLSLGQELNQSTTAKPTGVKSRNASSDAPFERQEEASNLHNKTEGASQIKEGDQQLNPPQPNEQTESQQAEIREEKEGDYEDSEYDIYDDWDAEASEEWYDESGNYEYDYTEDDEYDYGDPSDLQAEPEPPHSEDSMHMVCKSLGIFADPSSCEHFIMCVPMTLWHIGPLRMDCPMGTRFDDMLKVCNWKHKVPCDDK